MPSIINATTTNGVAISPDNSGSLQLATNNGTTAVTIDTNQNVGIGTSSPATKLTVASEGRGRFYRADNTRYGDIYTDNNAFKIESSTDPIVINAATGQGTRFQDAGTERMRITGGGNVGIGTTSPGNIRLLVTNNSTAEPSFRANNARATSGDVVAFLRLEANTNNTSSRFLTCSGNDVAGNGDAFIVYGNGNAVNVNGSYGTISDIKNKENIVDATPKLDKINQLQVRNFNFKGDDLKQIGFIAQEFEQVFPSMVDEHKDTDVEGNDLGTTTKSIKTSVLVPILVKAIQEQQAMIEELKQEVQLLKNPPVEGTE